MSKPPAQSRELDLRRRNHIHEFRLQRRPAHQEAVDIGLLGEFAAVLGIHAAAVDDAHAGGHFRAVLALQPLPDIGVDFLGLRI